MVVARNWGGSGIEEFLLPGETIRARFSNYFLTDRRIGKYRTLSSTFEFVNVTEISLKKSSGAWRRTMLTICIVIAAALNLLAYFMLHLSPFRILVEVIVIFGTYAYVYVVLVKFANEFIVIESSDGDIKWTIRSYGQKKGYTFLSELKGICNSDSGA